VLPISRDRTHIPTVVGSQTAHHKIHQDPQMFRSVLGGWQQTQSIWVKHPKESGTASTHLFWTETNALKLAHW